MRGVQWKVSKSHGKLHRSSSVKMRLLLKKEPRVKEIYPIMPRLAAAKRQYEAMNDKRPPELNLKS